jgi:arylsulfatase A-like enzyme
MKLSRRDFVRGVGAGVALAGLSSGLSPSSERAEAGGEALPSATTATQPGLAGSAPAIPAVVNSVAPAACTASERPREDRLTTQTVQIAENMEPVITHPEQEAEAKKKLAALEKRAGKKPNILIFIMDNVGWGEPGIYGGGLMAGAPTPNMDRLGREGLQLLSTYSQPSSSPSRCTLLTGRLPMRHGQLRPILPGEGGSLGDEITVAQVLSRAGYITQLVGKWYCGENPESQPQNVGFDDFYGFLGWSARHTDWWTGEPFTEFALSQALAGSMPFNRNLVHATSGHDVEDLEEINPQVSAELEDTFAAYSIEFIEKMAGSDKPFFLYHGTRGGHFGNYPNPRFKGKSPAGYPYKDMIIEQDDVLGRLVRALEKTGQLENTLTLVTSDNGPMTGCWPDAGYTPFRGGIGATWEGSVRVPGIVCWRGMISPGQVSDGLFDLADLFNTSIALAGVEYRPPKDRYVDAVDQTSFLLADAGESNRKYIYYWLSDSLAGLRVAEYKVVVDGMSEDDAYGVKPGCATTLPNYKHCKGFNLYLDPREQHSFLDGQAFLDAVFVPPWQAHLATFVKYPPKGQGGVGRIVTRRLSRPIGFDPADTGTGPRDKC